jgi:hypothetical protein
MNEPTTSRLIHLADAEQTSATWSSHDIAHGILVTVRRRRIARRSIATITTMLAFALVAHSIKHGDIQPKTSQAVQTIDLQREVESARAEAVARTAVVDLYYSRHQAIPRRDKNNVDAEIRVQRERSALILVLQADRMYRELNLRQSALAEYRRVVELFPDSQAAHEARKRLTEIRG